MGITNKITLAILAAGTFVPASAQDKPSEKPVHIKMIKIIDGDTTIIEKDVNEDELHEFEKEMGSIPGKRMNMRMHIDKKCAPNEMREMGTRHFNDSIGGECMKRRMIIDMDSLTPEMMFHFYDSALPPDGFPSEDGIIMSPGFHFSIDSILTKEFHEMETGNFFMHNDSMMNRMEEHIGYSFSISEDDDEVVVKQFGPGGEKVIVKKLDGRPGEELSEDIEIRSKDGKTVTRVMVRTTVKIEDMESPKEKTSPKREKSELKLEGLSFYPNPNNGIFTIDFEAEGKQPVVIRITNMNGREVYREEVKAKGRFSKQIDLSREGKGAYILILEQGKRSTSKKIVIE